MSTGVHICIARTEFWAPSIFPSCDSPHPISPPQFLHEGRRWIPRIRNWRGDAHLEEQAAERERRAERGEQMSAMESYVGLTCRAGPPLAALRSGARPTDRGARPRLKGDDVVRPYDARSEAVLI